MVQGQYYCVPRTFSIDLASHGYGFPVVRLLELEEIQGRIHRVVIMPGETFFRTEGYF